MLTAVVVTAMAAPRSVEQARVAALQQMKKQGANRASGQVATANEGPQLVYSKAGKNASPSYYVFSAGANRGFTIVSGDDRLPAIVGYTESGDFDANQLPTNLVSFMQAYQDFADNATDEQIAEIATWRAQAAAHEAVEPFMKEKWNQTAPYNNWCPVYKSQRCVTGCVATAVAQILHYYSDKHPTDLQANIPAYTSIIQIVETDGQTYTYKNDMPAIAAGEKYDWENMQNVYTGSEIDTLKNAVAKLMLHVGCAVEMKYSPSSSAASATPETFTKYFGMDKELVSYYALADYQIAEWDHMLYKEIAAKRPVYYNGKTTSNSGHAFVIHGYDDGFYYVNWGWGGYSDGYFDITILNPHNTTSAGASSTDDGYSMSNGMIIGIQPDNGVVDEIERPVFTARSLDIDNITVSNNSITASANIAVNNFNSVENTRFVGVGYINEDFQIQNVATPQSVTIAAAPEGQGYRGNAVCNISFPCIDGVYKLDVIESTDKSNWMACPKNTWATPPYHSVYLKVQNGDVSIIDTPSPSLTATAELDTENSGGYTGMNNTINITVSNKGDAEYYDKVYVMASPSSTMPQGYTYATGITAPVGGSTTFSFEYAPQSAGTYNFWILDKYGEEIGKSSIEFKAATAPVLSFVSIKCANASGEKVFAKYSGYDTEMDKVNDTKADFVFKIKNDGGYYKGEFLLYKYDDASSTWKGSYETLEIPANDTKEFTFTVEGNVGDVVGYMLRGYNVSITPLDNSTSNIHNVITGGHYSFNDREICYLAGSDTGVNAIKAEKENNVYYNLRGEKVDTPSKGVYIKNGKKYIFK
ncbi:MAG: C10 family peptidase [Prevotella sp.]|nr:C10 family peptidase [Prevotella sp.]